MVLLIGLYRMSDTIEQARGMTQGVAAVFNSVRHLKTLFKLVLTFDTGGYGTRRSFRWLHQRSVSLPLHR